MKKLSLAFAVVLLTGIQVSFAQSLQLVAPNTSLSGPANTIMSGHASITNISGGIIDVRVVRMLNDTAPGHSSYFCWYGACYPATTDSSPFTITYFPGDVDTTLEAKLDPRNNPGVSTVKYCFINDANPSDSVCVTYTYDARPVSVGEINGAKSLSVASPNPADAYTVINYTTTSKNARLVISNLLGAVVKEIPLSDRQNAVAVPTEDLLSGVYVYSLKENGTVIVSKKLVVSHK
jgi:hypothetical protein